MADALGVARGTMDEVAGGGATAGSAAAGQP